MNISEVFIRRPVMTTLVMLSILFFGMLGYQSVLFAILSKTFAVSEGLLPADPRLERFFKVFNLERGLVVSAVSLVAGIFFLLVAVNQWRLAGFGELDFVPIFQALRDVSPALFEQKKEGLPDVIRRRALHVIEENARVEEAVRRLEAGDLQGFGACMNRSHESMRDLYEISCTELDFLAATAQQTPGVFGARMTGGGFGGCTVNLVEKSVVEIFCEVILNQYERQFDRVANVYLVEENVEAGAITPASL